MSNHTAAAKATKFTATMPDGTVITRSSKTRTYTHVLVVLTNERHWDGKAGWGALGWAGSLELARKNEASWSRKLPEIDSFDRLLVVPVEVAS